MNVNYKIDDKVKIKESNDNDNYDLFRDKILIVTYAKIGGLAYDNTMYPELLMDFRTEEGEDVPFSLYEYEIEPA